MATVGSADAERIAAEALDLDDLEQRARYVAEQCSADAALRHEVEQNLSLADKLDTCADQVSRSRDVAAFLAGRRLGSYELVRELGRGGMGAVWLAQRADSEFRKQVAIKLLKRGTDTDEVLSRFRAERQILARLEHPNIAHLIDGGTTDDGLPYFVLQFVDGMPLIDFVRANKLSLGDRLQLFRKICGAVQFAHQNLVVHRDLKPSNILVTADGEPKLLDFGIAKMLAADENAWAVTVAGGERFTPGYASPEQVEGKPVTTVSDVYALGAILYEMLTGVAPHRFASSPPTALEIVRVVCDTEPSRPSAVATDAELRRQLRGDVDTIVLRALSKAPSRRYPSAGEFSEDVRRCLEGRPVRARADTVGYRARKFLGRNKLGVAAAALVLVAIIGGAIGTLWQAQRARARFNDVRGLANSFLSEFNDAIRDLPGSTPARRLLVTRAQEYLGRLEADGGNSDPTLQCELATAYLQVGDVQGRPNYSNLGDSAGALASYEHAAALAETLPKGDEFDAVRARAWDALSNLFAATGRQTEALGFGRRGLAVREALLAKAPDDLERQRAVGASCLTLGDTLMVGTMSVSVSADPGPALEYYNRSLGFREHLHQLRPDDAGLTRDLASVHYRLGNVFHLIGLTSGDQTSVKRGLEHHQRSVALREKNFAAHPSSGQAQRDLADGLSAKSSLQTQLGDPAGALRDSQRAEELMRDLIAADPENAWARQDLAYIYGCIANPQRALGDNPAAIASLDRGIALYDQLALGDPANLVTVAHLNAFLRERTSLCAVLGDAAGERAGARRWLECARRLAAANPADQEQRADLVAADKTVQKFAADGDQAGAGASPPAH